MKFIKRDFYGLGKAFVMSFAVLSLFSFAFSSADAAVSVKQIGSAPVASGGGATRTGGSLPTRTAGAIKVGGTTVSGSAARGASVPRNSIGKYLNSTANAIKPGSSIKVPGGGGGGGGYTDLSNYYTIPETDALLDLKQDTLIAGEGIKIEDNVISVTITGNGDGEDGREVQMRATADYIQWKYDTDDEWINLIAVADLVGDEGEAGQDGREVQMQVANGYIQWRLGGDSVWNNLVNIASLGNVSGDPGNVMMFDETTGQAVADTGIHHDRLIIMPTANQLTAGDGSYLIVANKDGTNVSGPSYVRIY